MLLKINNVEIFVSMPSNQIKYSYDIKIFKIGIVTDRGIEASRECVGHSTPPQVFKPNIPRCYQQQRVNQNDPPRLYL